MARWITDRLPTLEDADSDGDVQIKRNPDSTDLLGAYIHFSLVVPGLAWRGPISVAEALAESSAACAVSNESLTPDHFDPMEQARLHRYRAKTALIEARTTLLLAQAKAIAFPSESPHPDRDRVQFFFPPLACSLFR